MVNSLKKIIPLSFKTSILLFFYQFKALNSFGLKPPKQSNKRIFIFLAADYGNLGDVAITYAQHKFLQQNFPGYLITEIPISKTINGVAFVKKIISNQDIITTVGGGNMGDLYPMIEHFRQMVISNFENNMVVSFPQTIDFNENPAGKKALANTIKTYSKHNNLVLLAREQKTYDFFINNFKNNKVILVPDIVLSLDKTKPKKERKGVVICLRDDKEKKLNQEQEITLLKIIDENFDDKSFRDTHIGGEHLSLFNRVKALDSIWDDFRGAEVVITDRLHGMIFCYITNTPAIVFLNNNHKIKSSFKWINTSKHIHLMENFSETDIANSIKFLKQKENRGTKENLLPQYSAILKLIKEKK
ncbi:polysaccharide pyruvyl transferase family protein [Hwangdonia sp.]|uniref:polysaccharide pyruvyl transferase family protein n=1 Tax=Hwangdonia sp. TaxID=1883432 RepID=UPI003AB8EE6C